MPCEAGRATDAWGRVPVGNGVDEKSCAVVGALNVGDPWTGPAAWARGPTLERGVRPSEATGAERSGAADAWIVAVSGAPGVAGGCAAVVGGGAVWPGGEIGSELPELVGAGAAGVGARGVPAVICAVGPIEDVAAGIAAIVAATTPFGATVSTSTPAC